MDSKGQKQRTEVQEIGGLIVREDYPFSETATRLLRYGTTVHPASGGPTYHRRYTCDLSKHLSQEELDLIKQTVGIVEFDAIRAFLVQRCNVPEPSKLTWPDIFSHLKVWLATRAPNSQDDLHSDLAKTEASTTPKTGKEAQALILLKEHPDWSDTRIAAEVGVHRSTLYRSTLYRQAKELYKRGDARDLPKGETNAEGKLEAWDPYVEPFTEDNDIEPS